MTDATKTLTLTEFLLARIAEDEAVATSKPVEWLYIDPGNGIAMDDLGPGCAITVGPARILAECEAKRRIVRDALEAESAWDEYGGDGDGWPDVETLRRISDTLESQLKHLAAVYADHPDYDESWRI